MKKLTNFKTLFDMMMFNQMNLPPNQQYMMPQPNVNDYNYGPNPMYNTTNDPYINKNMFLGNQNPNKVFNNMPYYGNYNK